MAAGLVVRNMAGQDQVTVPVLFWADDTANPTQMTPVATLINGSGTPVLPSALSLAPGTFDADTLRVGAASDSPDVTALDRQLRIIVQAGDTLTRPNDTNAYAINDSISNSTTAGSVIALSSGNLSDTNDAPINLTEILLTCSGTAPGTAGALLRVHLFNSNPTLNSGVGAGDNATWSNKQAGWLGSFSGNMIAFSDGSRGVLIPDVGNFRLMLPGSGVKNIWWQLQTLTAFTPAAQSTFTPTFKGLQGGV